MLESGAYSQAATSTEEFTALEAELEMRIRQKVPLEEPDHHSLLNKPLAADRVEEGPLETSEQLDLKASAENSL